MTDEQIFESLASIRQQHIVGALNTPETRRRFHTAVQMALASLNPAMQVVCDDTTNPPDLVNRGGFGFGIYFKRDGESFLITDRELAAFEAAA
jgi:hypothetical protein